MTAKEKQKEKERLLKEICQELFGKRRVNSDGKSNNRR